MMHVWYTAGCEIVKFLIIALLDRPGPKMKRIILQFLPGVSFRSIPSPL